MLVGFHLIYWRYFILYFWDFSIFLSIPLRLDLQAEMLCFLQQGVQLLCKAIPRGKLAISRSTLSADVPQIHFLLQYEVVKLVVADHCFLLPPFLSLLSFHHTALHLQYLVILAKWQKLGPLLLELIQIH